jgi:hypothetical protein
VLQASIRHSLQNNKKIMIYDAVLMYTYTSAHNQYNMTRIEIPKLVAISREMLEGQKSFGLNIRQVSVLNTIPPIYYNVSVWSSLFSSDHITCCLFDQGQGDLSEVVRVLPDRAACRVSLKVEFPILSMNRE